MNRLVTLLLVGVSLFPLVAQGQSAEDDAEMVELTERSKQMWNEGFDVVTLMEGGPNALYDDMIVGVHRKRISKIASGSWLIWTREELVPHNVASNGKQYTHRINKVEIDCANYRTRVFDMYLYNESSVVLSDSLDSPPWLESVPGSNGEALCEAICGYIQKKK